MRRISIGELPLSVRASNCLMRAGASTFGALNELIQSENGLRSIRDLGKKSEEEIIQCFFEACYHLLTPVEQAQYWQMLLDANAERHKGDYPFVE
jgi:DNA-directed RNA polymerase alpha subunit